MARKQSKEVATWDEQLAQYADQAATMEANTGGGQFFSVRGGILTFQDAPLPNNEMAVIILDTIFENVYYEGRYDPDTPMSPTCFAFARDEAELEPHVIVSDAGQDQSTDGCKSCEHNEWGSAETGKGKACRNTRRLAMIPAGQFDRNGDLELLDDIASAGIGFMKLPVTSVNGYASFVKQIAGTLRRPPFGIITRVSVVPDPKTQFKVLFEPIDKVDDSMVEDILARVEEAKTLIDFPYQLDEVEEEPKPKAKSKAKAKAPAARRGRKY